MKFPNIMLTKKRDKRTGEKKHLKIANVHWPIVI